VEITSQSWLLSPSFEAGLVSAVVEMAIFHFLDR
jgi:hypothetical protein